jgi:hypothetical protein
MDFLNPYDKVRKANAKKAEEDSKKNKQQRLNNRKAIRKANRKHGRNFISTFNKEIGGANQRSKQDYTDYIKSTKIGKDCLKEQ